MHFLPFFFYCLRKDPWCLQQTFTCWQISVQKLKFVTFSSYKTFVGMIYKNYLFEILIITKNNWSTTWKESKSILLDQILLILVLSHLTLSLPMHFDFFHHLLRSSFLSLKSWVDLKVRFIMKTVETKAKYQITLSSVTLFWIGSMNIQATISSK